MLKKLIILLFLLSASLLSGCTLIDESTKNEILKIGFNYPSSAISSFYTFLKDSNLELKDIDNLVYEEDKKLSFSIKNKIFYKNSIISDGISTEVVTNNSEEYKKITLMLLGNLVSKDNIANIEQAINTAIEKKESQNINWDNEDTEYTTKSGQVIYSENELRIEVKEKIEE